MQIPISALVLCLGHLAMSAVIPDSVAKIEAKSLNVERELETRGQKGGVYRTYLGVYLKARPQPLTIKCSLQRRQLGWSLHQTKPELFRM